MGFEGVKETGPGVHVARFSFFADGWAQVRKLTVCVTKGGARHPYSSSPAGQSRRRTSGGEAETSMTFQASLN